MAGFSFYYMRHGRTHANEQGLCSGGYCTTTLTQAGRERIFQSARELKAQGILPQRVWLSPTVRTRETAGIVLETLGLPPDVLREEDSWRERHYGAWEGAVYEPIMEELQAGGIGAGGETVPVFQTRIRRAVELLAQESAAPVLLIAHGYVWQALHDIHGGAHVGSDVPWISNGDIYDVHLDDGVIATRKITGAADAA